MSSEIKSYGNVVANNKITALQGDVVIGGNKTTNIYLISKNDPEDKPKVILQNEIEIKQPEIISEMSSLSLPPDAWTHLQEISETYDKRVKAISLLTDIKEYEPALHLYWKILYYTGYRELWKKRADLSKRILKLSLRAEDYKTTGLILSKGMAYALMSQKKFSQAEYLLKDAYEYFRKANADQEEGVYFDYMAEIYEETGQLDKAINYYKEARKKYNDRNEYQAYLKQSFIEIKHDDIKSRSRVFALRSLSEKFSLIKNYREALADIELAKSLYMLKETDEALYIAKKAHKLLNDVIIMPRNAIKAKEVLFAIMERKPIVEV